MEDAEGTVSMSADRAMAKMRKQRERFVRDRNGKLRDFAKAMSLKDGFGGHGCSKEAALTA